jgi:hypothetical protein
MVAKKTRRENDESWEREEEGDDSNGKQAWEKDEQEEEVWETSEVVETSGGLEARAMSPESPLGSISELATWAASDGVVMIGDVGQIPSTEPAPTLDKRKRETQTERERQRESDRE